MEVIEMKKEFVIGIDLHSSTFDACFMSTQKKIIKRIKHTTSEHNLIKVAQEGGKNSIIVFEEGALAGWAYEIQKKYVKKVVVSDPRQNKWIYRTDKKNDKIDAQKLCELYIGGFIKEIYHPIGEMSELRDAVLFYYKISSHTARLKNQLKAIFRCKGIQTTKGVYKNKYEEFRSLLPQKSSCFQGDIIYKMIQQFEEEKEKVIKHLKSLAKKHKGVKFLQNIPGIGFIYAVTYIAIIVTPHRFANKRKLWSYAGFNIVEKGSGENWKPKHLSHSFNRTLKSVTKQIVQVVTRTSISDNKFKRKYYELLHNGIKPSSAKLTIARKLLSTILTMLKTGECFSNSYN